MNSCSLGTRWNNMNFMFKLITKLNTYFIASILTISFLSQLVSQGAAVAAVKKSQSSLSIINTNFVSLVGTSIILKTHGGSGVLRITFSTPSNDCTISMNVLYSSSEASCIVTATNPANGNYSSTTSIPKVFSFINPPTQNQSPLVITNTELTASAGSVIQLTSSGGSGQLAVTYNAVGSGCSLSGSTITSAYSANCIVTAINPANGNYSSTTSAPVTFSFTGKQQQDPLLITNKVLTNPTGAAISITTSGGSGVIATSFSVTGIGCKLSGSSLSSLNVAYCVVKAKNAANGVFAMVESQVENFIFLPQGTSCTVPASYNYPPLWLKASYVNGVLTISWSQQTLPSGTIMTYRVNENNSTKINSSTANSFVDNSPESGIIQITVYAQFSSENFSTCYFPAMSTIFVQIP